MFGRDFQHIRPNQHLGHEPTDARSGSRPDGGKRLQTDALEPDIPTPCPEWNSDAAANLADGCINCDKLSLPGLSGHNREPIQPPSPGLGAPFPGLS
jgi:hypothetical protein